jgi:hypothetical protein
MRHLTLSILLFLTSIVLQGQEIVIVEGSAVGPLKLGQSFEEVVNILGFNGDLKTYDDYIAEELFFEDPENQLECAIGFDYYVKYEHLLKLPIAYIYFKDNVINQVKVSSFPAYYFSIARATKTRQGLDFWATSSQLEKVYGTPDLKVNYDSFILNAYFYFDMGITINLRENYYRTAHIYQKQSQELINSFKNQF